MGAVPLVLCLTARAEAQRDRAAEAEASSEHEIPDGARASAETNPAASEEAALAVALADGRCVPHEMRRKEDRFYVACGRSGIWELERAAEPIAGEPVIRSTLGTYRVVQVQDLGISVVALDEDLVAVGQYSVVVAEGAPAVDEAPVVVGPVVSVDAKENQVLLMLPERPRVSRGKRVRFELKGGAVVGTIIKVDGRRSEVELGLGERAPEVGTFGVLTEDRTTATAMAPAPRHFVFALGSMIRSGPDLRNGAGLLSGELYLELRVRRLRMMADVGPLVLSHGAKSYLSVLGLGFAWKSFAMAVYGGIAQVNYAPPIYPGAAGLFGVGGRVGREDGLELQGRMLFGLVTDQALLIETKVALYAPLSRRSRLVLGGYHGRTGVSGAEAGVSVLLRGDGSSGSFFLTGTVGAMMTFRSESGRALDGYPDTWGAGPAFGLGAMYRL